MNLTIHGSGYVGLVTAACLAQEGNHVLCVDIDVDRVSKLSQCIIPIYEPGLHDLVRANLKAGRIEFTSDAARGIEHGRFQFIAVGTPPDEDGMADLQHVLAVAETVGKHMNDYRLVVNKSTVPVGTSEKVAQAIQRELRLRGLNTGLDVVSNPEFLKEGAAIKDFMKPDRIIIGADNAHAETLMLELYAPFISNHDQIHVMNPASAELTKYAANAMLATRISFMNELANLAERLGVDIEKVRRGIGSDPRIGDRFLFPGCGYGGSCFPKDVKALQGMARQVNYTPRLIAAVDAVNQEQKQMLYQKIHNFFKGDLRGKVFALWGLAFKPGTDDMREASSRNLIEALWESGAKVQAYDPAAMTECQRIYGSHPSLQLCETADDALSRADALVIVTEWEQFRSPDFMKIRNALRSPVIFDGRNLYDPDRMQQSGFKYFAVGRGDSLF